MATATDFGLTHPVLDNATLSGTAGYSNELYNRTLRQRDQRQLPKPRDGDDGACGRGEKAAR